MKIYYNETEKNGKVKKDFNININFRRNFFFIPSSADNKLKYCRRVKAYGSRIKCSIKSTRRGRIGKADALTVKYKERLIYNSVVKCLETGPSAGIGSR